ncbi:protein-tyrosine phosphatase-like protein, partial [Dunaliella salina]
MEDGSVCEVVSGLFLGSLNGLQHAKALGIRYIVSVLDGRATALCNTSAFGVHYIDIPDLPSSNILEALPGAIKFIHKALTESPDGSRVYVHCMAGVSRSVTIVAAYLMHTQGCNVEQAIQHIRRVRRSANPNDGFREQLHYWSSGLSGALDYLEHNSKHHTAYTAFFRG